MYGLSLAVGKSYPTISSWIRAARHGFLDLAELYRSHPAVQEKLRLIMADDKKGLTYLIDRGVPVQALQGLFRDLARRTSYEPMVPGGFVKCANCAARRSLCSECDRKYS
jgi:hypothetical protein